MYPQEITDLMQHNEDSREYFMLEEYQYLGTDVHFQELL